MRNCQNIFSKIDQANYKNVSYELNSAFRREKLANRDAHGYYRLRSLDVSEVIFSRSSLGLPHASVLLAAIPTKHTDGPQAAISMGETAIC
jgi:hypothetical protein